MEQILPTKILTEGLDIKKHLEFYITYIYMVSDWHTSRRIEILSRYPSVRNLYRPDPSQIYRAFLWLTITHILLSQIQSAP